MQRSVLFLVLGLVLAACTDKTTGPDGSGTPEPSTITMTQLSDLPMVGGNVASVAITTNNSIIAIVDGKLYSMSATGGPLQLINGDADHAAIGVAPSGELYAVMGTAFRTYDLAAGTFHDVAIDAAPFAQARRIEEAEIMFSPAGEPYVRLINNTPQTYIYYTTTKGASWTTLPLVPGFKYSGGLGFTSNGDVIMSSAFGFYRSSDHGATWTTQPAPLANYGGNLLGTSNGNIYYYVRGGGGLEVSKNGGASFTDLATFNRSPFFLSLQEGPDGALYALANRSVVEADPSSRPTSLLRSTDGGVTWRTMLYVQGRAFAIHGSVAAIGIAASGYGTPATGGGVVISQDRGATWMSNGTNPVQAVTDIGFDKDGGLMMLADHALFRRTSAGWQTLGNQPGLFARFASSPQGTFLLASISSVVYSGDNGVTWTESAVPNYQSGIDPASITALIGKPDGGFLMSIASYADNRGYSNGQVYQISASGVPVKNQNAQTLSTIVQDHNGLLYGGTQILNQSTYTFEGISYRSTDGGTTWVETKKNPGGLAFNSANKYFSVTGLSTYTLTSADGGQKTDLKLAGFTSQGNGITEVKFGPDDKLYLIARDNGLFVSSAPVR